MKSLLYFFFFQAEDGIRDIGVTGVQTCALPICFAGPKGLPADVATKLTAALKRANESKEYRDFMASRGFGVKWADAQGFRSEERRVGKECRSRWSPYH